MQLSNKTLSALGKIITGDNKLSPYKSGPILVDFFNQYGGNTIYGSDFPSRWLFAEGQLTSINGTSYIKEIIEEVFDPRHYLETEFSPERAIEYINKFLRYDDLKVVSDGTRVSLQRTSTGSVVIEDSLIKKLSIKKASHIYILEQSGKCKDKLLKNDFDGAITNARTMVEAVFIDVLNDCGVVMNKYDGDLNKLYKLVKDNLNLSPKENDLSQTLKQILAGLSSIVTGIAGISNKMGDRHSRQYKPERHHAVLAINTANSLCEFVVSSLEYQKIKTQIFKPFSRNRFLGRGL